MARNRDKYKATDKLLVIIDQFQELSPESEVEVSKWIAEDSRPVWLLAADDVRCLTEQVADKAIYQHTCG